METDAQGNEVVARSGVERLRSKGGPGGYVRHFPQNTGHNPWRIVYRNDPDAIVILEVFSKKSPTTPKRVIEVCKKRLKHYDQSS